MITHHPSEPTLAAYATGHLSEVMALVVATHLGGCSTCRQTLAALEAVGGVLLDELPLVPLSPGALDRLLGRLDEAPAPVAPVLNADLPAPINRVPLGRWWPIGFGVWYRPIQTRGAAWGGLLWARPGRSLPRHGHAGLELTCVLSGAFADVSGVYHAGDLAEPEVDHDQPPVVVGAEPCLCILGSEGMRLRGVLGWAQRAIGQS